jgi:quinol monooxygenase YgiN
MSHLTLVNVFTVAPEQQQKLADHLLEATEKTMSQIPGFVSATIHKSLDGKRVVNYAQWDSQESFEAMRQNPDAIKHMEIASAMAHSEPILCEVVRSISEPAEPSYGGDA